jgi:hypothetical protein
MQRRHPKYFHKDDKKRHKLAKNKHLTNKHFSANIVGYLENVRRRDIDQ